MALSKEEIKSILLGLTPEEQPEEQLEEEGEAQEVAEPSSPLSPAPEDKKALIRHIIQTTSNPPPQQFLSESPIPPSDDAEEEPSKLRQFAAGVAAGAAAFTEGFAYGLDLFSIDDEVPVHPWVDAGSRILGEVTRMAGEMFLSAGAVSAIRGLPWVSRALSSGGTVAKNVLQRIPGLARLVDKGAPLAAVVGREAAEGLVYSGIDQLLAPEERKPGLEGAAMNVVQFAGGGIGFRAATRITERVIPKAHPVLKRLIGFSGDTVTGALAAYGFYDDKSQIYTDIFAAETIAIGVIDLITYAMSKGRLNPTPEALEAMDRARQAKMIYDATGSPADEARMWQALNDAVEASLPEGAGFAFEMRLLEDIQKDWMQDVERARSPEARPREEPSADVAARPQLEGVTPPAPETPTPTEVRPPLQREPAAPPEAPPTPEVVTPRPAEAPQPPRPEPAVTPERITGETIARAFNYEHGRIPEISEQIRLMRTYADAAGFTLDQVAALAKIETDFKDVGAAGSSARGPLQVTELALKDLEQAGVKLQNDINTLEGKIEAGVAYLKLLRDRYKLSGDELIAAYFSGPTYVRNHGITDEVQYGQISNREYVRRYKEALDSIRRTAMEVVEPPEPARPEPTETPPRVEVVREPAEAPEPSRPVPEARRPAEVPEPTRPSPEETPPRVEVVREPAEVPEPLRPAPEVGRPVEPGEPPRPTPEEAPPRDPVEVAEEATPSPEPFRPSTTQDVRTVRSVFDDGEFKYIKFSTDADALLFDYARRLQQEKERPTHPLRLRHIEGFLRKELNLSDDIDLEKVSIEWRRRLTEKAREMEPEQVLVVPPIRTPGREIAPPPPARPIVEEPPVRPVEEPIRPVEEPIRPVEEPVRAAEEPVARTPEETPARAPEEPLRTPEEPVRSVEEPVARPTPEETAAAREPERTPETPRPRMDPNIRRVWDVSALPEAEARASFETPETRQRNRQDYRFRDTSQAEAEFRRQIEEFTEWLKAHPGEITPERLRELQNFVKPGMGFSINTTRMRSSGPVLDSIHKLADIVNDPRRQSLREVEAGARKILRREARNVAEQLGLLKEDVDTLAAVMANAPETVTALRGAIVSHAAEVFRRAEQVAAKGADNLTDLEAAQFYHSVVVLHSLTSSLKQIQRQVSRTLGAGRIVVGDKWIDLTELNIDDLVTNPEAAAKVSGGVSAAGGKSSVVNLAKKIVRSKNVADMNRKIRKEVNDKPWMRALMEQRGSGLLTNFRTAFTNTISQVFNTITEHTVNFTAAGINLLRGGKGGMTFGEATARLIGDITGMIHAFVRPVVRISDAAGIRRNRKLPSVIDILSMFIHEPTKLMTNLERALKHTSLASRLDVEGVGTEAATSARLKDTPAGRAITRIMDILGFPIRVASLGKLRTSTIMWAFFDQAAAAQRLLGYGVMELADRPFTYGGYYSELAGQIYRRRRAGEDVEGLFEQVLARRKEKMLASQIEAEALASGLSGEALEAKRLEIRDRLTGGVLKGLSEAQLKRIDEIDNLALENARYMTFKDPIETPIARTFEGFIQRHPVTRIFAQFYHTPVRILEKAGAMTPFLSFTPGILSKTKADILGYNGRVAQDLALARWAVGASLYGIGAALASSHVITPTAADESEARRMKEAGLPEHSIRIGDKWVDINKFDPAPAIFFTTMANFYKVMSSIEDDDTAEEIASALFFTIVRSVMDKTWMTSVRQTLDAIFGYGSDSYLANLMDSIVPFKGLRNMAETWPLGGLNPFYRDHMMEFNGFLERFMPTRPALDTFGKLRETPEHIMGIGVSEPTKSPIRQELVKLGLTLPKFDKTVDGVELDDDMYWQLRRYMDSEVKAEDKLNSLVRTPQYQRAPIERKKEMILTTWLKLKEQARNRLRRDPKFKEKYREEMQKRLHERTQREYPFPDYFQGLD